MVRFRFLGFVLMGVAAAVWMACSGDDNTTGTSIGAEGQACLPGNQCIAGFECENGTCKVPSENQPTSDGGVGGVGNPKATAADCEDIGQQPQALCPTPDAGDALCTDQSSYCCAGQGCQSGNDACNAPEGHFACFATAACTATQNGHCCLFATPGQGGACQATTVNPGAGSICTGGADTPCGDFEIELCKDDTDCPPNGPCTKTVLTFKGVNGEDYTKTVGYCAVPAPVTDSGAPTDAAKE